MSKQATSPALTVLLEMTLAEGVHEQLVRDVLEQTLTQTREWEGSTGVEVLRDLERRSAVVVLRWRSAADYEGYLAWRRTPAGAHQLGEIMGAAPVIRRFTSDLHL